MERPVYHIPGAVREKQEARDFVGPLDLILHLLRKDKIAIRDIPLAEIPRVMGLQAFWIAALISAGYLLTRNGLRRAVILGG